MNPIGEDPTFPQPSSQHPQLHPYSHEREGGQQDARCLCQLTLSGNRELVAREGDFLFSKTDYRPMQLFRRGWERGVGSAVS